MPQVTPLTIIHPVTRPKLGSLTKKATTFIKKVYHPSKPCQTTPKVIDTKPKSSYCQTCLYISPTPKSYTTTKSEPPRPKGPPITAEHSHDSQIAHLFNDGFSMTDCRAKPNTRSAFAYENHPKPEPPRAQRSIKEMETLWTRGFLVSDSAYAEAVHCLEITQEAELATWEASINLRAVTGLIPPPGLEVSKTNIRMDMEFGTAITYLFGHAGIGRGQQGHTGRVGVYKPTLQDSFSA
ncbi:hypothetical protein BDV97DRAFT_370060 [Delphinella strobiligena]|nr:hypothetical protein BDV97DRAFT_370060 [Delphinella strobiligena]